MNTEIKELSDFANELLDANWNLTHFEALQIASKIIFNNTIKDALSGELTGSAISLITGEIFEAGDSISTSIDHLTEKYTLSL